MPAVIDTDLCIGCGQCEACPGDVIHQRELDDGRMVAWVKYPDECWYCGSCRQDCPAGAITIVFSPMMLVI
jgi:adenylylsulfate reductase, subunit B